MKKFTYIIFCISVFVLQFYAQQPTEEWVRRYSDTSSMFWSASSIKSDSVGHIYVLAQTNNDFGFFKYDQNGNLLVVATYWPGGFETGGGSYFDVTPAGDVYITGRVNISINSWMYTVKFNTAGVFLWGKVYNADNGDVPSDIKADNNGNVIVVGGSLVGSINYSLAIKYNSLGDTLWTKYFNDGQNEAYIDKLVLDNANNIYVTGYIGLPGKCLIMKYSSAGNLDWFTTYANDTNRSHIGQGIALDLNGNIYVILTATVAFSGLNDYLLKLTNGGAILWNKVFTGIISGQGRNTDFPRGPVISKDGNSIYYSTMSANGTGGGGYSIATVKYNSLGDSQWVKVYNGGGVPATANRISAIKLDKNDNIYICGLGNYQTTGDDFVTIKYAPTGIQQWVAIYSGVITNGGDGARDLFVDTSLNVFVTGNSPGLSNQGVAVTIKYNQPVGIISNNNQLPEEFKLYQNYPNPFNPETMIYFDLLTSKKESIALEIYDVTGKKITTILIGILIQENTVQHGMQEIFHQGYISIH